MSQKKRTLRAKRLQPKSRKEHSMDRRNFIKAGAVFGGALAALGPFQSLSARRTLGHAFAPSEGYGPLVNKGHLWLPAEFNYQIVSVQGSIMSDGQPTPGIFDGMAAYP